MKLHRHVPLDGSDWNKHFVRDNHKGPLHNQGKPAKNPQKTQNVNQPRA
jgi:hypothetical protein